VERGFGLRRKDPEGPFVEPSAIGRKKKTAA
jgi:hypothetical protein